MEARFVILHPDDAGEILSATALIRCLKTQVEEAYVYSIVKESHRWLLEQNPNLDEIFVYQDNPKELIHQIRDLLPDYLIDLDGTRAVRRFKHRVKVLDFTINRKNIGDEWMLRAFRTCDLFDIQDDEKGMECVKTTVYQDLLPHAFLDGYIVLSLNYSKPERPVTDDQIIQLAAMTEKPIVVTGDASDRALADRIGKSTGCAVFPTCGDLSLPEMASIFGHAKGAILFDPFWVKLAEAQGVRRIVLNKIMEIAELTDTAMLARSLFQSDHEWITH